MTARIRVGHIQSPGILTTDSGESQVLEMDLLKKGKFEMCLEMIKENLRCPSRSVSTELMLQNDALICQYILELKDMKNSSEEFKLLLIKCSSLSPSPDSNRLGLVLLHNYIYCDLLTTKHQPGAQDMVPLYTQATRVLYKVYSVLQPVACNDLRRDLPTDAKACCYMLLHRCLNSLTFGADLPILEPFCHVAILLALIEMRSDNWEPAIVLLSSIQKVTANSDMAQSLSHDSGFLLPLCLEDTADVLTSCPTDWANFLLGVAYFQTRQWKQSRDVLQRNKEDFFLPYVSYLTGHCLIKEDLYTEALAVIGQVIKTHKLVPIRLKAKLFNLLGDCFGRLEKPQLSIQMYKEALAVDFGYQLPLYNISLQYQKLGTKDVELECLNLLVTTLESNTSCDVTLELDRGPGKRFVCITELITTDDDNISYQQAVYTLACRCLQMERYDVSCQKYQDLIACLTNSANFMQTQNYRATSLPSLRQIYHEAILSLLKAGKYSECLELCDRTIACYHGRGQGHNSYLDNTQNSIGGEISNDKQDGNLDDTTNNNLIYNRTDNVRTGDRVVKDNEKVMGTLKRKRQDSDAETDFSGERTKAREVGAQTVLHDSDDTSDSGGFDALNCDGVALKYKAEVLEKLGDTSAAIDCLERAMNSLSIYRKASLQKNIEISGSCSSDCDQPAAKRQRTGSRSDDSDGSLKQIVLQTADVLTKFEAELYQFLGSILDSREQYSDALHYYRLAAQLFPESTQIHYLCTKTLLSMKCPKVACNNWLRHRKLVHISTPLQYRTEIARKEQSIRSGSDEGDPDEKKYVGMDIKCLQMHQQQV